MVSCLTDLQLGRKTNRQGKSGPSEVSFGLSTDKGLGLLPLAGPPRLLRTFFPEGSWAWGILLALRQVTGGGARAPLQDAAATGCCSREERLACGDRVPREGQAALPLFVLSPSVTAPAAGKCVGNGQGS